MPAYRAISMRKPMHLTEEEALALLEMCLYTEAEDDPLKMAAMIKVADLCREFMRPQARPEAHPRLRNTLERLLSRRESARAV